MIRIVYLTPEQFDKFSFAHPLHSFYQTTMYANLMANYNYSINYIGMVNEENIIIGATMFLSQKLFGKFKYGYAPRGFLIDFENKPLVIEITNKLKEFLAKDGYVFLKLDPLVINNKRDNEGQIVPSSYPDDTIPFLKDNGYNYFGENKFFGTMKPRWNAILKVVGSSKTLFENFDNNVKNKIRKAQSRGVVIYQGTHDDIELFYSFVAKKHYRKLEYYKNFAKCFGERFELYFAKLDSEKYLKNIKILYETELSKNDEINSKVQEAGQSNTMSEKLMNTKMSSDKLLAIYKKELLFASDLFEKNPEGIIIGSCAIILDRNGVELLIEGMDSNYGLYYPMYLLKWYIIDKFAKQGAVYFDLNAITGYFSDNNKFRGLNEMKLGFDAEVTEYVGEFDLIIHKKLFNFYNKTKLWQKTLKKQIK